MLNRIRAITLVAAVLLLPGAARAQTPAPSFDQVPSTLTTATLAAQSTLLVQSQAPIQQRKRDSLLNGVLIGAGVGAMIGAASGIGLVDCSCSPGFNVPLTFGALGAGIGAGIGAAIDALRHERTSASQPRRVKVTPLLGKGVQGMAAWIRF